ncbi:MAG: hypothetical protein IKF66_07240, partial [Methanobrevibacter sp.]|nr:hypothetical protein [Methanobrevibacter sp.]
FLFSHEGHIHMGTYPKKSNFTVRKITVIKYLFYVFINVSLISSLIGDSNILSNYFRIKAIFIIK